MMVTIRPAKESDAAALALLQKEAFLALWERYHDRGNPYLRGEEDILPRLGNPKYRYFCILVDGVLVGGIFYGIRGDGEYYLHRLYVKPEVQGVHVGREAIRLCEAEFGDAARYLVDFPQDLEKNRRCYEAAGFCDTGIRKEVEPGLVLAYYEKVVDRGRNDGRMGEMK